MSKVWTPYQRVMRALHGGTPDITPFTVYENKVYSCTAERELRNNGMCIVNRIRSYQIFYPNVKTSTIDVLQNGKKMVKTIYSTPYGDLSSLVEPAGYTSWRHECLFKSPDDYKALLFLLRDAVIEPNYAYAAGVVADLGEDFVVRDNLPLEPMQNLISADYMKTEDYCIEWMDNRDEILKLYDAFVDINRRIYPIIADGPLKFSNYGGNVTPQIIGGDNFVKYYIPHYNEAADILHKKGKLIGCHFDADNTAIMQEIGTTKLDYIEAYDPWMSPAVKTARQMWPDKVLWINWPSAGHLYSPEKIVAITEQILQEAAPGNGFLIGITEDLPEGRWKQNFSYIVDTINEYCLVQEDIPN
jgi:hypothetical protein